MGHLSLKLHRHMTCERMSDESTGFTFMTVWSPLDYPRFPTSDIKADGFRCRHLSFHSFAGDAVISADTATLSAK